MSNPFAALSLVSSGQSQPRSSALTSLMAESTPDQTGDAERGAVFAGVLATMMPTEDALVEKLPGEVPAVSAQTPELPAKVDEADDAALVAYMDAQLNQHANPSVSQRAVAVPVQEAQSASVNSAPVRVTTATPPVVRHDQSVQSSDTELESAALAQTTLRPVVMALQPERLPEPELPAQPSLLATAVMAAVTPAQELLAPQSLLQPQQPSSFVQNSALSPAQTQDEPIELKVNAAQISADVPEPVPMPTAKVVTTAVPTTSSTAAVVSVPVSIHNERAFSEAFGLQLVKLASQGITQATVRINPQELGPIDVRIVMNGQQAAQVDFQARQAQTVDMLETMMPRLVSAMDLQGIRLEDARVNLMSAADAQSFAQQFGRQEAQADAQARDRGRADASAAGHATKDEPHEAQLVESAAQSARTEKGRIDYYA